MEIKVITNEGVFNCTKIRYASRNHKSENNPVILLHLGSGRILSTSSKDIFCTTYTLSKQKYTKSKLYDLNWVKGLVRVFWMPDMLRCQVVENNKDSRRIFIKYNDAGKVVVIYTWKSLTEIYTEYK